MNRSSDARQVIYVAASVPQAQLLAGALEEEGIAAFVNNEALQTGLGGLLGFDTAPRVLVDEADAPRAREFALDFERRLRESHRNPVPGRSWYQFTIRGLLFLTVCVAIYFGVDQAISRSGASPNSNPAVAAVFLFCLGALYLAFRRKRRGEEG